MSRLNPKTRGELHEVLGRCSGGEEIEVAGTLANLSLRDLSYPAAKPVKLKLTAVAAGHKYAAALEMIDCSGIDVVESDLSGTIRSRYDRDGRAVMLTGCADVTVERSRLHDCWQGVGANNCDRIAITENDITEIGPFGIQVCAIRGFVVRANQISGFNIFVPPDDLANGEHADAIMLQMVPSWSPDSGWAETGCTDVEIEKNFVLGDPDNKPQGVFLRDTARTGGRYERVTIRDNDLWGTMWSGIAAESFDDQLIIADNRLRSLIEEGRIVDGGHPYEARIALQERPAKVLTGNSACAYLYRDKATHHPGVAVVDRVKLVQAKAALVEWRSRHRAGVVPAPTPAPIPAPSPPDDLRRLASEARGFMNEAENLIGRAMRRMDRIDRALGE